MRKLVVCRPSSVTMATRASVILAMKPSEGRDSRFQRGICEKIKAMFIIKKDPSNFPSLSQYPDDKIQENEDSGINR